MCVPFLYAQGLSVLRVRTKLSFSAVGEESHMAQSEYVLIEILRFAQNDK